MFQVVFLIDLDAFNHEKLSDDVEFGINVSNLRRTLLKVLTFYVTGEKRDRFRKQRRVNEEDDVSDSILRWGYKFYCSSTKKKTVRQRCSLTEFDLDAFERFEDQLEKLYRSRRSEFAGDGGMGETADEGPFSRVDFLENALKESLFDFPWDEPIIASPVRKTKRRNGGGNVEADEDGAAAINVCFIVSRIPKTNEKLAQFLLGDSNGGTIRFDVSDVLNGLVDRETRRKMCDTAKIRLVWLDVYGSRKDFPTCTAILDVFGKALGKMGGGVIPGNAAFPVASGNPREASELDGTPMSVLLSRFSSHGLLQNDVGRPKRRSRDAKSEHFYADLRIPRGLSREEFCLNLRLIRLFKENAPCSSGSLKPRLKPSSRSGVEWHPKELKVVSRSSISDASSALFGRKVIFVCFPKDDESKEQFNGLLNELSANKTALVAICDDSFKALFFPSNNRNRAAWLHVFVTRDRDRAEGSANENSGPIVEIDQKNSPDEEVHGVVEEFSENSTSAGRFSSYPNAENQILAQSVLENLPSSPKSTRGSGLKTDLENTIVRNPEENCNEAVWWQKLQEFNFATDSSTPNNKVSSPPKELRRNPRFNAENEETLKTAKVSNEEELMSCTKDIYEKGLKESSNLRQVVVDIMKLTAAFFKDRKSENREDSSVNFVRGNLLKSCAEISADYKDRSEENRRLRVAEHCTQSILRLEIIGLNPISKDDFISEIISHLRALPFLGDPAILPTFLNEIVAENYYASSEDAVTEIYDELNVSLPLQPHPEISSEVESTGCATLFENFASPLFCSPRRRRTSSSSFGAHRESSSLSSDSLLSSPSVHRQRIQKSLKRHPSFKDCNHKRQIVVPFSNKIKTLSVSVKRLSKDDCGKLSKDYGRHGLGIPASREHYAREKRRIHTTPNGRHVLKTQNVADTPTHKQVDRPILTRQISKRKSTTSEDDENLVVEESPDKQNTSQVPATATCRRSVTSRTLRRQPSFYSTKVEQNSDICQKPLTSSRLREAKLMDAPESCGATSPNSSRKNEVRRLLVMLSPESTNLSGKNPGRNGVSGSCETPRKSLKVALTSRSVVSKRSLRKERESEDIQRVKRQKSNFQDRNGATQRLSVKPSPNNAFRKCSDEISDLIVSPRRSERLLHPRCPNWQDGTFHRHTRSCSSNSGGRSGSSAKKVSNFEVPTPQKRRVSRKLLLDESETGSCDASLSPSRTSAIPSQEVHRKYIDDDDLILSTPVRNGARSPVHVSSFSFLDSVSGGWFSRSSSPIIPLFQPEFHSLPDDAELFTWKNFIPSPRNSEESPHKDYAIGHTAVDDDALQQIMT